MIAFTFPQPGEQHNASAIPVLDTLLVNILYLAVVATHRNGCDKKLCLECENNRASCVAAFALLPGQYQRLLDLWLAEKEHITPPEWRL